MPFQPSWHNPGPAGWYVVKIVNTNMSSSARSLVASAGRFLTRDSCQIACRPYTQQTNTEHKPMFFADGEWSSSGPDLPAEPSDEITPSWAFQIQLIEAALTEGSAKARDIARRELARMAKICDAYAALTKKGKRNGN